MQVLERAKHRCELCNAPSRLILRGLRNSAEWTDCISLYRPNEVFPHWSKPIKVVLTVAHLDQTYKSHDLKHLLALCQRCHFKIDKWVSGIFRRGGIVRVDFPQRQPLGDSQRCHLRIDSHIRLRHAGVGQHEKVP